MNSVKASVDDTEIPRIMEIESANKDDFISKIERLRILKHKHKDIAALCKRFHSEMYVKRL